MMRYVLLGLILALSSCSNPPGPKKTEKPERFEWISSQNGPGTEDAYIEVIHDRETGQEIACYQHHVYVGYSPACWLTGRRW